MLFRVLAACACALQLVSTRGQWDVLGVARWDVQVDGTRNKVGRDHQELAECDIGDALLQRPGPADDPLRTGMCEGDEGIPEMEHVEHVLLDGLPRREAANVVRAGETDAASAESSAGETMELRGNGGNLHSYQNQEERSHVERYFRAPFKIHVLENNQHKESFGTLSILLTNCPASKSQEQSHAVNSYAVRRNRRSVSLPSWFEPLGNGEEHFVVRPARWVKKAGYNHPWDRHIEGVRPNYHQKKTKGSKRRWQDYQLTEDTRASHKQIKSNKITPLKLQRDSLPNNVERDGSDNRLITESQDFRKRLNVEHTVSGNRDPVKVLDDSTSQISHTPDALEIDDNDDGRSAHKKKMPTNAESPPVLREMDNRRSQQPVEEVRYYPFSVDSDVHVTKTGILLPPYRPEDLQASRLEPDSSSLFWNPPNGKYSSAQVQPIQSQYQQLKPTLSESSFEKKIDNSATSSTRLGHSYVDVTETKNLPKKFSSRVEVSDIELDLRNAWEKIAANTQDQNLCAPNVHNEKWRNGVKEQEKENQISLIETQPDNGKVYHDLPIHSGHQLESEGVLLSNTDSGSHVCRSINIENTQGQQSQATLNQKFDSHYGKTDFQRESPSIEKELLSSQIINKSPAKDECLRLAGILHCLARRALNIAEHLENMVATNSCLGFNYANQQDHGLSNNNI